MSLCNKSTAESGSVEYLVWCTAATDSCTFTKNFNGNIQLVPPYGKVCFNGAQIFCGAAAGELLPSCASCLNIVCGTTVVTNCPGIVFWGCLTD